MANIVRTAAGAGDRGIRRSGRIRAIGDNPPSVDPHPTVLVRVSTSNTRSDPQILEGATLSGNAYIHIINTQNTISRIRYWMDAPVPGTAPGITHESFIGSRTNLPMDMNGTAGGGLAAAWNTLNDPTGNGRLSFTVDGTHTLTVSVLYSDGLIAVFYLTFTVDNNPTPPSGPPAAPTWTGAGFTLSD